MVFGKSKKIKEINEDKELEEDSKKVEEISEDKKEIQIVTNEQLLNIKLDNINNRISIIEENINNIDKSIKENLL